MFRDYHAGLIAEVGGDDAEAEKRLKAAYEAEKRRCASWTPMPASWPAAASARTRRSRSTGPSTRCCRATRDRDGRHGEARRRRKPLAPPSRDAPGGAAEVLYGLGAAGDRQGDELAAMIYLRLAL